MSITLSGCASKKPREERPRKKVNIRQKDVEQPGDDRGALKAPPQGRLYNGVYPGSYDMEEDKIKLKSLLAYEKRTGKKAAWVYFSDNWYNGREFPLKTASWIRKHGSIPFIRLMLRSREKQDVAEHKFTLERIIAGDFDDDLRSWARQARRFKTPLLVEFGTEVNGRWFSWNGHWNGRGKKTGYGRATEADGPEKFRDAYRHIISISRQEKADNITWVFHANNQDIPDTSWNRMENYYPGDEWIDWLGVSVYGAQDPLEPDIYSFRELMDDVYPRLKKLSKDKKPIALLEFGVTSGNPRVNQAKWSEAALKDLVGGRWPRLIGLAWWNEGWENDDNPKHDTSMIVKDNPDLAAVLKKWVGGQANVLDKVLTETP